MTDDDNDFVLDASGNLVLIGLTLEETIELERLDNSITADGPLPHISRDEWRCSEEKRWLELWTGIKRQRHPSPGRARHVIECYIGCVERDDDRVQPDSPRRL
jgi:hypothetical protein